MNRIILSVAIALLATAFSPMAHAFKPAPGGPEVGPRPPIDPDDVPQEPPILDGVPWDPPTIGFDVNEQFSRQIKDKRWVASLEVNELGVIVPRGQKMKRTADALARAHQSLDNPTRLIPRPTPAR